MATGSALTPIPSLPVKPAQVGGGQNPLRNCTGRFSMRMVASDMPAQRLSGTGLRLYMGVEPHQAIKPIVFGTRLAKEASCTSPAGGEGGDGGDAGPLGSAEAHPHPDLPRRGEGTSAAPDDNVCAEQYCHRAAVGRLPHGSESPLAPTSAENQLVSRSLT
jgi:hypothetical protein